MDAELEKTIDVLLVENRDKKLGELSEELRSSLRDIKTMIDDGDLDYETLKSYIKDKIGNIDEILPNTVGRILLGCADKEGSCILGSSDSSLDSNYMYDHETNRTTRISGTGYPLNKNSWAVIHTLGDVDDIDLDVFKMLDKKMFEKVKILKKNVGDEDNEEMVIDNLKEYIYSRPERLINLYYLLFAIGLCASFYVIYRYKDVIFPGKEN